LITAFVLLIAFIVWNVRPQSQRDLYSMGPDQQRPSSNDPSLQQQLKAFELDEIRAQRLTDAFPELAQRLEESVRRIPVDPSVVALAKRHVLSAQALLEVLQEPDALALYKSAFGNEVKTIGSLMRAVSERVGDKLRAIRKCPAEIALICAIYPEVDLDCILAACEQGLIEWRDAAAALQEIFQFHRVLRRLDESDRC